jgi:hypothetical protein
MERDGYALIEEKTSEALKLRVGDKLLVSTLR